ncbi:MAG: hypothetical protein AVDCRST_MAG22-381 [uncultured Rubrobacteraceae bacterium]|uniref:Uncharacterized protein n=1 Tax=uncultured Rubrobacteraceae bacterium TaxID=349277 RepID=A0A6J4NKM4_9ACTN|nr:MAG: hypothetical protein AVDCRST_MAG22-381 [uncultured Rubrobacteraceae bacterium]
MREGRDEAGGGLSGEDAARVLGPRAGVVARGYREARSGVQGGAMLLNGAKRA